MPTKPSYSEPRGCCADQQSQAQEEILAVTRDQADAASRILRCRSGSSYAASCRIEARSCRYQLDRACPDALGTRPILVEEAAEAVAGDFQRTSRKRHRQTMFPGRLQTAAMHHPGERRTESKQAVVIAMLQSRHGATIEAG